MAKELTGRCACGAVQVKLTGAPRFVGYCHCNDCRKATGAPVSLYVGMKSSNVELSGTPKGFATSKGVTRSWCEICGTPISFEGDRWPNEIHFHIGLFDHPEAFKPTGHTYLKEKLPWFDVADDLHRSDEPSG